MSEYKLSLCGSLKKRFSWRRGGNIPQRLVTWTFGARRSRRLAWRNLVDVRQTYPDTDAVKVRSGRTVLVFNIRRNDYRLIAAAHFNRQIVYDVRFMTHAEYSKDRWKAEL